MPVAIYVYVAAGQQFIYDMSTVHHTPVQPACAEP